MKTPLILFASLLVATLWAAPGSAALTLTKAGTYSSGIFDESAAEIVDYDPATRQAYVVNGYSNGIDVLDLSDISKPSLIKTVDLSAYGAGVNSVAVHNGRIAAAVEGDHKQAPGKIVVFDGKGVILAVFNAGALPDMVTFTPDGNYILSANEGEPNDAYDNDPEGSVTIVDISGGLDKAVVHTAGFTAFNSQKAALRAKGVRISYPTATVAQDLEPEYLAVSTDSKTAYVTLQENNAIALVDIPSATVTDIIPMGLKDWAGNGWKFDASDKDGGVNLASWPVYGCFMPDTIAAYNVGGNTYLVTANEGDSREYEDGEFEYTDEVRCGKADLDPTAFPDAASLQQNENLGRLKLVTDLSDTDEDDDLDRLVAFGGRSFSIFDTSGHLVFDSGGDFEEAMAKQYPDNFNASNDNNDLDDRSDDKGPEPEALALGTIKGRTYVFAGLERMSGFMVYDVTDPASPSFELYELNRDFSVDPASGTAGDLGPECIHFVPAAQSPNGKDILLVGNEVSGTTTVYEISSDTPDVPVAPRWMLLVFVALLGVAGYRLARRHA